MNYPNSFAQFCKTLGPKFTSLRKEILYILWCATKPLKAYEILDALLKTRTNSKPPTVYRTLEFLVGRGIVHKIESIQSYTLCCEPDKHLLSEVLMVCSRCHQVIEVHDKMMQALVKAIADNNDFQLEQHTIELKGSCQQCAAF